MAQVFRAVDIAQGFQAPPAVTGLRQLRLGLGQHPLTAPVDAPKQPGVNPSCSQQVVTAIRCRADHHVRLLQPADGPRQHRSVDCRTVAAHQDYLRVAGKTIDERIVHALPQVTSCLDSRRATAAGGAGLHGHIVGWSVEPQFHRPQVRGSQAPTTVLHQFPMQRQCPGG